jgi:hypothetical protein
MSEKYFSAFIYTKILCTEHFDTLLPIIPFFYHTICQLNPLHHIFIERSHNDVLPHIWLFFLWQMYARANPCKIGYGTVNIVN